MLSRNQEVGSRFSGRRRWPLHVRCRCKKVRVRYLISWWVSLYYYMIWLYITTQIWFWTLPTPDPSKIWRGRVYPRSTLTC